MTASALVTSDFRTGSTNNTISVYISENGEALDISGSGDMTIYLKHTDDPSATAYTASFITNGIDGGIIIDGVDFISGDEGNWHGEVFLEDLDSWDGPSSPFTFRVRGRVGG